MKNLLMVFGGQSSEHDVSVVSAVTVAKAVDPKEYRIWLTGITKDGRWIYTENLSGLEDGSWEKGTIRAVLTPDTAHELILMEDGKIREKVRIDVAFPVLHGLFGEDGTIQGLFELAHLPYVGCGPLSSAVTMDKFFTKVIARDAGVTQAEFVPVRREDLQDMDRVVTEIEQQRTYPVFIKPSNAGSSVGITKAHDRAELIEGLKKAAVQDEKILVEETISGREIECAVYGHGKTAKAMGLGEVLSAAEFYDYEAKYHNAESKTVIHPDLPAGKEEEILETALKVYRACDCFGFARVDFFLENGTNRVVFNEINTIPGHTSISMYPMILEAAGYPMKVYINDLIHMAEERHQKSLPERK